MEKGYEGLGGDGDGKNGTSGRQAHLCLCLQEGAQCFAGTEVTM